MSGAAAGAVMAARQGPKSMVNCIFFPRRQKFVYLFASFTSGWISCCWGDAAWIDWGHGTPHEQLHVTAVQAGGPQVGNSYLLLWLLCLNFHQGWASHADAWGPSIPGNYILNVRFLKGHFFLSAGRAAAGGWSAEGNFQLKTCRVLWFHPVQKTVHWLQNCLHCSQKLAARQHFMSKYCLFEKREINSRQKLPISPLMH